MITLDNLSIGYGASPLFEVAHGEFASSTLTALIGRNGSGKSTLLRAIAGLNRRYRGDIRIDGSLLRDMDAPALSRRLAFVTTERTRIAAMRCRDIVAIGRAPYTNWIGNMTRRDRDIVDHALRAVGMQEYADRSMQTMSDGECQRIMIARALAQDTPAILLDEPTSFLDMPGRYALASLLGELAHNEGKCIIFSTHELDIATERTDFTALISDGTLTISPSAEIKDIVKEKFLCAPSFRF